MNISVFLLLFAYILIASYGSKLVHKIKIKHTIYFHSFASGILIAALLLFFLDEIYKLENSVFFVCIVAISFALFFSINAHGRTSKRLEHKINFLTYLFEALHYLVMGIFFAHLLEFSTSLAILTSIPILVLKFIFSYEKTEESMKRSKIEKYIMEIMTIFGFVIAILLHIPEIIFNLSLSIVSGGIFYSIVSLIFSKHQINTSYMISGTVCYGLLFIIPIVLL